MCFIDTGAMREGFGRLEESQSLMQCAHHAAAAAAAATATTTTSTAQSVVAKAVAQ